MGAMAALWCHDSAREVSSAFIGRARQGREHTMTGAQSSLRTAVEAGVGVCFANPGTTEMPLVQALDEVPGMRAVLATFEGVCSGAADGYARMLGRPALTLLHLGPGLANAVSNLHNARRAASPIVNLVGDHATWHRDADAPLASDIASLARPVSCWVRSSESALRAAHDAAEAIAAARETPGVATLILPADCQWGEAGPPAPPIAPRPPPRAPPERIAEVAALLRAERPAVLYAGGRALTERGQWAAARIAHHTGCRVMGECFPARQERGAGLPRIDRLPYFPERVVASLAGVRALVLAGVTEPVSFFGYPGVPSRLTPAGCRLLALARPNEDVEGALEELADALDAPPAGPALAFDAKRPELLPGPLTPEAIGAALALTQPEGAIVVDESGTTGSSYFYRATASPRHTLLTLTGGSLGLGPACATGAAIACPDRVVLDFQGDGSALYTFQSLWTQAREQLHVVTVICANHRYRILEVELQRAGVSAPGPQARALTSLSGPEVDFVQLARGLGVPGTRVDSSAALRAALERGIAEPGPHLIELAMA
jgi:acetolactate synthase I/II/III large subunit